MSTFVLVHGALHGGWCWYKVAAALRAQGHTVFTPDLPGLGVNRTATSSVSLQLYTDHLSDVIAQTEENVHLVGHSMGGIAITQTAEAIPQKIKTLTYLTAFLLPNGETVLDHVQSDTDSKTASALTPSSDNLSVTIDFDTARNLFFADCSGEDLALAQSLLVPQALAPMMTPVQTTQERWGRIPRAYIECSNDQAISPALQRAMHKKLPCEKVMQLSTSHSPFFSAPEQVVKYLLSWSACHE
ncbi:MAG: alpha/beta fold hydrolase [Porticoccaceae bacterium]|nr:alpha/beta fold hydrolase [Pseudomonadales bacterium]MCP5172051.1 alpha/beta fold hydrolase [Pseudomonadales bacterium]